MPKIDIEDVEDCYTFYVCILGIAEDIFWYCDISFVKSVSENKSAYNGWLNYETERQRQELRR